MTQLSISFKTSTRMTNLKHNNRDLTEEEDSMKAHEHIQRENSKYNIEIIKGNLEKTYEKIFDEPLKEYNDKQKRNDRKIKNYLNHIKKSKKYDVQREFILAVGDKKVFEKNDINFKVEFSEKILKPMVLDFINNNPNLYVYNAVIHVDEIGAPHAHINVIPIATGYKNGLRIQPSFKKALHNQGFKEKGKHQYKQFRDKQVQIFEKHLNNYNLQRKIVGTNSIKDVREYKEIMSEIDKQAMKYKKAKIEQINTELDVYKEKEYKSITEEINKLKSTLKELEFEVRKNDLTIIRKNKEISYEKRKLEKLNNEIKHKTTEFEVLRGELDVYKEKMIQSTEEENKRLIDTLKREIRYLENETVEKINNMSNEDEEYMNYKKDIAFVKEMTGLSIKELVVDNLIKENNIHKYKIIINKAKEIFEDVSVFNSLSKIKEFLGVINKISFVSKFSELYDKYKIKFDKAYSSIYPKRDVLSERIEKIQKEQKNSLHTLLKEKAKEKVESKNNNINRDYGLER